MSECKHDELACTVCGAHEGELECLSCDHTVRRIIEDLKSRIEDLEKENKLLKEVVHCTSLGEKE